MNKLKYIIEISMSLKKNRSGNYIRDIVGNMDGVNRNDGMGILDREVSDIDEESNVLFQVFYGMFKMILDGYQEDFKYLPNILSSELLAKVEYDTESKFKHFKDFKEQNTEDILIKLLSFNTPDQNAKIDFENLTELFQDDIIINYYNNTNIAQKINVYDYDCIFNKVHCFIDDLTEKCYFKKLEIKEALEILLNNSYLGKMNESQVTFFIEEVIDTLKLRHNLKLDNNVNFILNTTYIY